MRSEFQFFMNNEDHSLFDEFISKIDGVEIKTGQFFDDIYLLDGKIQYERSKLDNGVLSAGRIAIATTDLDGNYNFSSFAEIEKLYKKLRNWLKKRSINNLVCFNESLDSTVVVPTKNFWVAKGALNNLKASEIKFKQFHSASVVFKLA